MTEQTQTIESLKETIELKDMEIKDLESKIETMENADKSESEDVKALTEKIKELEDALEKSSKDVKVMKDNGIIMDKKKLDPKKSYVTGPSGVGYVEAKNSK